MRMRAALALGLAPLLIAADEPPAPLAPLPELVEARLVEGRFEPGHFEYLRGWFPDASPQEQAEYAELAAWLDGCEEEGRARLDGELAAMGAALEGWNMMGAANLCQQVVRGERFEAFAGYAEVAEAARSARLVFDTLVQAVALAQQRSGHAGGDDLSAQMHRRTLADQMLRSAFTWGWSEVEAERMPKLGEKERVVFLALLNSEVLRVDHANTRWLKRIVDEQGWPTISQVGRRGASDAWLLAQHADLDPAFQLRVLRLMEPLLAEEEVSPRNYAYLYDRVMLKLRGKQRYATQFQCSGGTMGPRPLEEPERIDELRAEMQLEPLEEYAANFSRSC